MFCNHCGGEIQANQRFCGSCGGGIAPAPSPRPSPPQYVSPARGRVTRHLKMLAAFWIALSAINLLRGGGRLVGARVIRFWGRGWFEDASWGGPGGEFIPVILSTMGMVALVLAVIGFIVGFGLMERRPWARSLAIIVAVIALFSPLLGTVLGIYTLWVLLPGEAEAEFRNMSVPR